MTFIGIPMISKEYNMDMSKKRKIIIVSISVVFILLCLFLFNRTNDKKISPILVKGIEKRFNLSKANDIDDYEKLVNTEKAILKYDGKKFKNKEFQSYITCLLYTSPSPRDLSTSRMPSSA